jgi:hypothetical protein
MSDLIQQSLPDSKWVRIHASGDYFNQNYFDAWLTVAKNNPNILFYGYTKAIPLWVKRLKSIPKNFKLTASYGGTHDHLIKQYNLRYSLVVKSPEEAKELGLEIDHDDKLAYGGKKSFALLLHGQQKAGSKWSTAWSNLKKRNMGGYGSQKAGLLKAAATEIIKVAGLILPINW